MNHVYAVTCRTFNCGLRAAGPMFKLLPQYSISQIPDRSSSTQRTERDKSLQLMRRCPQSLRICNLSLGPKKPTHRNCLVQSTAKADFSTTAGGAGKKRRSSSPTPQHNKPRTHAGCVHTNEHASSKQGGTKNHQSEGNRHGKNALKELPQDVITKVFGPAVSQDVGNDVLQTLQLQRITGTLDQKLPEPRLDDHLIANGLAWLRTNYPVDEDAAIIKRIEEEELKADSELVANAERIGLYKPQQDAQKTGIYGKSGLDAIKKHYEDRQIKTQADEIRNAAGDSAVLQTPSGRAVLARRSESAEWVKRYKEKAEFLKASEPAKMSKFRRLFPSAVFVMSIVGLSILFAQNYVPPPRQARLWPDTPPAAATVLTIIAMNIAVFMVWRLVPPMWGFMNRYFLLIAGWPRPISLLGNCFSHQKPVHLASNMVALWFIGTQEGDFTKKYTVHDDIGRGPFLAIFLSSAVIASFFSLSRSVLSNNLEDFHLAFLPEDISPNLPANAILILLIGIEIFAIARGRMKRVDHWAHLGGYVTGICGAHIIKYKQKQREDVELERRKKIVLVEDIYNIEKSQLQT
ncbi:MAG: hypothetical protein Q9187_007475 [Circinaria calcarea]